jgi:hypothetical protein
MQSRQDLTLAMAEVRERLFAIMFQHEQAAHGGRACWPNRLSALAYLAHCLGIGQQPGAALDILAYLEDYDRNCVDAKCGHAKGR